MSKYNLGQNERVKCALTVAELCAEIADENEDLVSNSPDTVRNKFKNHDKSGIIDKLGNMLGFRIEDFDDKYDQLKLLKYLYCMEKKGVNKGKSTRYCDKTKIRIIDVLNKPRMDNINTSIASNSIYGCILLKMKSDIEKELTKESIALKKEKFKQLDSYWEKIAHKTFDYVMGEMALNNKEAAYNELERIEIYLKDKILKRLPNVSELRLPYKESLFDIFYNILLAHEVLCYDTDRLRVNYQIALEDPPEDEYVEAFIKCEDKWLVKKEHPVGVLNKLCKLNDEYDAETSIISMIVFRKHKLSKEDIGDAKFAFKYVTTLLSWLAEFKNVDFKEGYPLAILASVIQEIIFVKKNNELFTNDFYGNKYYKKTMISSIKDSEAVSSVVKTAWIYKIENRYSVNLGAYELVKKKRDIENIIYDIKRKIFEYQNVSDLEIVNSLVVHFAARSLTSKKVAMAVGIEFAKLVIERCGPYQFQMFDEGINVLNMFREFLLSRETMEMVANEVGEMIRQFDNEKSHNSYTMAIAKGMGYRFQLSLNEKYDKTFLFLFFVDRERKIVEYKNFMEIVDDEYAQKQLEIGLGEFIRC